MSTAQADTDDRGQWQHQHRRWRGPRAFHRCCKTSRASIILNRSEALRVAFKTKFASVEIRRQADLQGEPAKLTTRRMQEWPGLLQVWPTPSVKHLLLIKGLILGTDIDSGRGRQARCQLGNAFLFQYQIDHWRSRRDIFPSLVQWGDSEMACVM